VTDDDNDNRAKDVYSIAVACQKARFNRSEISGNIKNKTKTRTKCTSSIQKTYLIKY